MHSLCTCHFFRRGPSHQKWQWYEQCNNDSEDEERTDEGKDARLRIHHQLELCQGVLARACDTTAGANCRLLQCRQVAVKECVAAMEMRGEIDAAYLPMTRQIR